MIPAIALVPVAVGLGSYASYLYKSTAYIRRFKEDFNNIMIATGIENKNHETFKIVDIHSKNYGLEVFLNVPDGLSIEHLNNKLNILQDNFNGIVELEKDRFKNYIQLDLITKDIAKYQFTPVKAKESELSLGKDYKGRDFLLDVNKNPHLGIFGTTGSGKSFLLASILSNLLYNSADMVDIYLNQVVKSELACFRDCKGVKFTATTFLEVDLILDKIRLILENRSELFDVYGIRNITQYNKHYPKRKLKRIYFVIEEISFFMEEGFQYIWNNLLLIAKAGRALGIHLICASQRAVATEINPTFKQQLTKVCLQMSSLDSVNILGVGDAKDLKEREILILTTKGFIRTSSPWIDEDYRILHNFIKEIHIPNHDKKEPTKPVLLLSSPATKKKDSKDITIVDVPFKEEPPKDKKKRKGEIDIDEWSDF
ncbi:FtsK/SpoIIIE domain-containing protein [Inconstantimicrobium mannanitabidum]|uniref:Uncharacterized protein n=1 Tax=Inconstantimicrobium mannanitabidum TaxID=1604901 RepID=A0ACB5R904_9CLOT|nr:FtsK/SpoIIIE domain-containing protein [Clostridium sp. TW13]GKX65662.1 hypothetical protein rsdtw13_09200 [Clostridium sp. TW13]